MDQLIFRNQGILIDSLDSLLSKKIDTEIDLMESRIKDRFSENKISNLEDLNDLNDILTLSQDLEQNIFKKILSMLESYDKTYEYFEVIFNSMVLKKDLDLELSLERTWINLQRKGEFLPMHNHSGLMSFVIWAKIPYLLLDEEKQQKNIFLQKNMAGHFQFLYTDTLGNIRTLNLPVDKTWQGKIAVFPSKTMHCVYPFYSTDEYRFTIAGNISLELK